MKENYNLYPLKFHPVLFEKIWGGTKLNSILNKNGESDSIGESWEISTVPGNISVIKNGTLKGLDLRSLIGKYKGEITGETVYNEYGTEFPLLIKFIDAQDNLSIQVHPDNIMAQKYHDSYGKTEMWYVLDADKNSSLISGFNHKIAPEEYPSLVDSGDFISALKVNPVSKGDIFFIPAGRIHAIGKGIMVAEIQQMSDITYRVYDFDRTDSKGQKRDLHICKAAEALNFNDLDSGKIDYNLTGNHDTELVKCKFFNSRLIKVIGSIERDYNITDSFRILMCVEGAAEIITDNSYSLSFGETILIPAQIKHIRIKSSDATIIEIHSGE